MRILILEDGSWIADELARMLRRQGCVVELARSKELAATVDAYDLLILALSLSVPDSTRLLQGEVAARVRALLRRVRPHEEAHRLVHGPLIVDVDAHRAYLAGEPLALLPREWAVLHVLLTHAERVVSKETISRTIANWGKPMSANTVETYVSRLRTKLEPAGLRIRTVHRVGYMLETDAPAARKAPTANYG